MTPAISVSVVVPSLRRPAALARCLDGLARQRRAPDEVLVVVRPDDRATHEVAGAAGALARVRVVEVTVPGLLSALRVGAAAAAGDVVAFTDDDAIARPDWLARLEAHFADPRVGAAGGRDVVPGENDESDDVGRITSWGRLVGNQHLAVGAARPVDVLKGVNMAFRREALALPRELRGRGAQVHSEVAICAWAQARGWRVVFDPGIVVDHVPAVRAAGDERAGRSAQDVRDASFNLVFAIASLYPRLAWRRAAYGLLVGDRMTPGLLRAVAATARGEGDVRRAAPAALRGQAEALVALARGRRQEMVAVGGAGSATAAAAAACERAAVA